MRRHKTSSETIGATRARGVKSLLFLCGLLGQVGCESADTKACRDNYLKAHALINAMDEKTIESLQPALDAVESTLPICKKANAQKELAELEKAQRNLQSSIHQLRSHGPRKELSPEELDKLVKDGDPNCPKGQLYTDKKSNKQVKCTGPQIVALTRGQAEEYFKNRGFRVKVEGTHIDAEFGPESYHYEFSGSEPNAKPLCLKVFATLGMSWEESASRVTGVHPGLLKKGVAVRAEDGSKWPLVNIDNEKQAVYTLGKCGG